MFKNAFFINLSYASKGYVKRASRCLESRGSTDTRQSTRSPRVGKNRRYKKRTNTKREISFQRDRAFCISAGRFRNALLLKSVGRGDAVVDGREATEDFLRRGRKARRYRWRGCDKACGDRLTNGSQRNAARARNQWRLLRKGIRFGSEKQTDFLENFSEN